VDLRCRGEHGLDRGPGPRSPDRVARLEFGRRGAATDLARLLQQGSLRGLRPNVPAGEPACAVLLNTSGGIGGGDVLEIEARLAPGAAAIITTPSDWPCATHRPKRLSHAFAWFWRKCFAKPAKAP
jgi:hypothetical protein